ncbi:MAG: nucleoside deaminase [Pseudomonadota bacterium]
MTQATFMDAALDEARQAERLGEVPVGAVVVRQNAIIGRGGNRNRTLNDPTAHAEIVALRAACAALQTDRLPDCDLYVTLEPCTQCAAAISFARIRRLYFGAEDTKGGAVVNGVRFYDQPTCFHAPDVYGGIHEDAARLLLTAFFQTRRS